MTISFEMAPKGETCRLVATSKHAENVHLTILHREQGFLYFDLAELTDQSDDIQAYIHDIESNILAGRYQMELVEMNDEEICC
ncbi:hypothetical protein SAMN04488134_101724 [Amphibacillus marinus]|uniref:Uncharacterized protein n=1 Tax=Amphibacillus marinus TaxID=872970 RepID=A0A1H8IV98_9BACI|nr:hypothetical protein [Amphibacillus marinus]SEN71877.1 hypothetical protein SAMN04488134_101724 [Amphibacillus marinus]